MRVDHIQEQGTAPVCEDALLLGRDLYGVFDGATSLDATTFEGGLTGGRLAADIACRTFAGGSGTLKRLAEHANDAIGEAMARRGVDLSRKEALWSTAAVVVRLEGDRLRWVQIGDSLILIVHADGSHTLPVTDYDHDSELLLMWKRIARPGGPTLREALAEELIEVRRGMNRTYGVLNGEPEALGFLRSGTLPLAGIRHLLLFTDGLFLPKTDPAAPDDFHRFTGIYREGGLPALRRHVRTREQDDPHCLKYPRVKLHDDMTAIALTFP